MAPSNADRLELYQAFRTTFGDKVSETFIEEWVTRDWDIRQMRNDIKNLEIHMDERFNGVNQRLDSIENWIRVMVLGFLGFASTTIFLALQLR